MNATYTPHHFNHSEGHIFLGHGKEGACTIQLTGAASMSQAELNELAEVMTQALRDKNKVNA